jgi:hexosaminidase
MKLISSILFVLVLVVLSSGQSSEINIIPKPNSVLVGKGSFVLSAKTKIYAKNDSHREAASILNDYLDRSYGFRLEVSDEVDTRKNVILFYEQFETGAIHYPDQYRLEVDARRITISGYGTGRFYALQTLMQIMPIAIGKDVKIPAMKVADEPRFPYRGMHLDVARHFMPVEFVKKYIDLMSQYKFNYFHWHLTEDQGWRIEIKKYPRLTDIGSKRSESQAGPYTTTFKGDGIPIEGFYTQEQIKDVVAYAKARYITVIPEIELPGHASAALAAYPQFGCKADYKYEVKKTWGIFKEVYCPTDETFKFLEDVLDETIKLFPDSPYIHIGGDEVLKDHWKESAFVQELKKRENLKDEHEVQSYFVRRIEKFINSKGKKMIGWDEILEGGLAPNATVMSWRGTKGGIEAAKAKHDVIMTPTDYVYLDYGQGDPAYEPLNIGSYVPLDKVYSFEPVPKELTPDEAKYIIGGQANVWTEYMKTPDKVEYMAFPRMLALSEVLWSKPEDKNYTDFLRRLNANLPRLDKQNVNYRIPEPGGLKNAIVGGDGKATIELSQAPGTKVYYTLDGATPDEKSSLYAGPIGVTLKPDEVVTLKTIVVNGAGRKSSVYAATIINKPLQPSVEPAEKRAGVTYAIWFSNVTTSTGADSAVPMMSGETRSIGLQQFAPRNPYILTQPFKVSFDGYLNAPSDGIYELQVDSTWDASVFLGGGALIDDLGTTDRKVRSAVVPLKAGWHKVSVRYNHRGGDAHFRVRYGIKGQGLRQIGGGELVH